MSSWNNSIFETLISFSKTPPTFRFINPQNLKNKVQSISEINVLLSDSAAEIIPATVQYPGKKANDKTQKINIFSVSKPITSEDELTIHSDMISQKILEESKQVTSSTAGQIELYILDDENNLEFFKGGADSEQQQKLLNKQAGNIFYSIFYSKYQNKIYRSLHYIMEQDFIQKLHENLQSIQTIRNLGHLCQIIYSIDNSFPIGDTTASLPQDIHAFTLSEFRAKYAVGNQTAQGFLQKTPTATRFSLQYYSTRKYLMINALGCHGVQSTFAWLNRKEKTHQRSIAEAANYRFPDRDCTFLLGDNFYSSGLGNYGRFRGKIFNPKKSSALRKNFIEQDYSPYEISITKLGKNIPNNIPSFAIIGNHDRATWKSAAKTQKTKKDELAFNQVNVTYQQYLYVTGNPVNNNWHMPYFYYHVTTEFADFYFIDSSTFPFDEPQQQWLKQTWNARDKNKWQIISTHHALQTIGKRNYQMFIEAEKPKKTSKGLNDAEKYAKAFGLDPVSEKYKNHNQHELLYGCMSRLNLHFNLVLSAHDHGMAFYPELNLAGSLQKPLNIFDYQIISGGGGAKVDLPYKMAAKFLNKKLRDPRYRHSISTDSRNSQTHTSESQEELKFDDTIARIDPRLLQQPITTRNRSFAMTSSEFHQNPLDLQRVPTRTRSFAVSDQSNPTQLQTRSRSTGTGIPPRFEEPLKKKKDSFLARLNPLKKKSSARAEEIKTEQPYITASNQSWHVGCYYGFVNLQIDNENIAITYYNENNDPTFHRLIEKYTLS